MNQDGIMPLNTSTENRFQYNGKELEKDGGIDLSDYGARWYDGSIGRWISVDPLASDYFPLSPYAYVGDNPIHFLDPDGRFRRRFGAWLYSVFNGGDVVKNKSYLNKNFKFSVKFHPDGGGAGLHLVSSWKNSRVKVKIEGEVSVQISHGLNKVKDTGIAGYSIKGPSTDTKYSLVSLDRGVGYGNEYNNDEYGMVDKVFGFSGESFENTVMSARIESGIDVKYAYKQRYDFTSKKWVGINEYGLGVPFLEAKYSRYSSGGGKVRLGAQEDVSTSIGLLHSVKVNMRYQVIFTW